MLYSMTGFGNSKADLDFGTFEVSIQSVNHRYFNMRSYICERFQKFQMQIEKELKTKLMRGSVILNIKNISSGLESKVKIDKKLAKSYLEQISELIAEVNPDPNNFLISQDENADFLADGTVFLDPKISPTELVNLPGVLEQTEDAEESEEKAFNMISNVLNSALNSLIKMREEEGKAIADEFMKRLDTILSNVAIIETSKDEIFAAHHQKLLNRVNEIISGQNYKVGLEDIAREVALSAERTDISEEISRITHHINQFKQTMQGSGEAGRKLDFIAQEMLREANTIASKSSSAEINSLVVEIKVEIDKIKEQVQNIL